MSKTIYFTYEELLSYLKDRCKASTQTQVAIELDISQQYLGDVLRGNRTISKQLALKLGFEKITMYRRIK